MGQKINYRYKIVKAKVREGDLPEETPEEIDARMRAAGRKPLIVTTPKRLRTLCEKYKQDGRTQMAKSLLEDTSMYTQLTAGESEHLYEANQHKHVPSYNDLWDQTLSTFKLGKGKTYFKGRVISWEKHVRPHEIGKMPINQVTDESAREFILSRDLKHDAKTKLVQQFKRLSKLMIKQGHIKYCPFADLRIRKDRTTKDKIKFFHPTEEYPLLLEHAPTEEDREFYGISMGSGARPGETRHFRWEDVDMSPTKPRLTFRFGGSEDGATKSGTVKTVPMVREAYTWYQRRIDRLHEGVKPDSGLVFESSRHPGEPYGDNHTFHINEAMQAAGIKKKGRSLYAFRHGFCVALANGFYGEELTSREIAREFMRQDDPDVIDEYYRVLTPRLASKAAQSTGLTVVSGSAQHPKSVETDSEPDREAFLRYHLGLVHPH